MNLSLHIKYKIVYTTHSTSNTKAKIKYKLLYAENGKKLIGIDYDIQY